MISTSPWVVALRTTYVHYPRDGALAGAVLAGVQSIVARLQAWRTARRRAWEAERWLESASDRDLADIGLARRHRSGLHGVPAGHLLTKREVL